MTQKMEVSIGEFGRMIFEMVAERPQYAPAHWRSIQHEAAPLVKQLLALNKKMDQPYEIIGVEKENGKKSLSQMERIKLAQIKLWGRKAGELKVGNQIWLYNNCDHEMYITQDSPVKIIDRTDKFVYVEMRGCNYEFILNLKHGTLVLLAPNDFEDDGPYTQREYWLNRADELGI
jgi:hypothetical protein